MIILSVLAALAVNKWQEARDRARHAGEARVAFGNEIKANHDLLLSEAHLPLHRVLQTEYAKAAKGESFDTTISFETSVHPPLFRDAAWRSFSTASVMADLPPQLVLAFADIYHSQDSLDKRIEGFLNAQAAPRSDRETPAYQKDVTRAISLFLNDLVPAEERLVKTYTHALERLASRSTLDDAPTK